MAGNADFEEVLADLAKHHVKDNDNRVEKEESRDSDTQVETKKFKSKRQ